MFKKSILAASVIALTLGLSACGGGGATTKVDARGTQGQQLLDLKEAYDKGVINEKEYNKTKERILKS
ncbi:MAG: SHOCT domain-containing protein [Gammaproteobacteria bacterium]|jgi:uncharacterized membrane protein|nr:SHOCT domain-containing protein [Gammaproteobacteria bacterium]